jgi:hypothetical protein
MYMVDNIKEIAKTWKAQYKDCQDLDEKAVMLAITAAVLFLLLAFFVGAVYLIIAFIEATWWIFLGVGAGLAIRHYLRKEK